MITSSYPDGGGGSEAAGSFVEDFSRELSRHTRVTVLAASGKESVAHEGELTIKRFAVPRLPLSLLKPYNPVDGVAILRTLSAGRAALEAVAEGADLDHIFALWALPCGHWAQAVASKYGINYSIWALGSDIWGLGKIPFVRTRLRGVLKGAQFCYADGFELAAEVEAISQRSCEFLASTRKLPTTKPCDGGGEAPYKLAFLGRWHLNKGIDLLLDALLSLDARDWKHVAEIRINGGGPLESSVRESVSKLQSQGRPVTLGGYLDKRAAADLIAWADYLLLPSRIESIPVVFSDAVQLTTPLVASPVGDLPRLHSEYRYGILASEVSADAYRDALRVALTTNPGNFRDALTAAGRVFDLQSIVARFVNDTIGSSV
ncbi:MAG: glycosyltransferase [Gammaproteobacteria bacterium]